MNIFSKTFCRIYQSAFRIAMPLLPYRKPLIFTNVKECVPLFQKLNLTNEEGRVLLDYLKALALIGIEYLNNKEINDYKYD